MQQIRHNLLSDRCAWCNRIWTGKNWMAERRRLGREKYSHGICKDCAEIHFSENQSQGRSNLVCFWVNPNRA